MNNEQYLTKITNKDLERLIVCSINAKESTFLPTAYERAWLEALKYKELEIEGYERSEWTEFDPSDESTYPPNKTHVLVYGLSDNMKDDEKLCGLDVDFWLDDHFVCYRNITHWRPLPNPPQEEKK